MIAAVATGRPTRPPWLPLVASISPKVHPRRACLGHGQQRLEGSVAARPRLLEATSQLCDRAVVVAIDPDRAGLNVVRRLVCGREV